MSRRHGFTLANNPWFYCHRGSKRAFAQVFKARLGVTIPFRRFFKNSCVNSRFQTIYMVGDSTTFSRNLVFLLFNVLFVCFFGTGNINAQSPPRQVLSTRPPRREDKRNTFDDLAFEEVMRGKRQALGDGHFDQLGVWVPESSPSEDSLKEELYRGDGSFGKSLLKAQGLFARKRREGSEQEKIVTVVSKSGRFGNEKTSDVKGIHACLALIHRRCQ